MKRFKSQDNQDSVIYWKGDKEMVTQILWVWTLGSNVISRVSKSKPLSQHGRIEKEFLSPLLSKCRKS